MSWQQLDDLWYILILRYHEWILMIDWIVFRILQFNGFELSKYRSETFRNHEDCRTKTHCHIQSGSKTALLSPRFCSWPSCYCRMDGWWLLDWLSNRNHGGSVLDIPWHHNALTNLFCSGLGMLSIRCQAWSLVFTSGGRGHTWINVWRHRPHQNHQQPRKGCTWFFEQTLGKKHVVQTQLDAVIWSPHYPPNLQVTTGPKSHCLLIDSLMAWITLTNYIVLSCSPTQVCLTFGSIIQLLGAKFE